MLVFLLASVVLCALLSCSSAQVGPTSTSLASFSTGPDGLLFNGGSFSKVGYAVAQVGDHNGDGIVDFAVTGPGIQSYYNGVYSGAAVLFLGTNASTSWSADVDMTTIPSGMTVRRIFGSDSGLNLGSSVGGAGDINSDGFDDLLVGAASVSVNGENQCGAVIVVFGLAPPYTDVIFNASFLATGLGYTIYGTISNDQLAYAGTNTRGVGDVNGDDIDDFAVSSRYFTYAGKTYAGITAIIYGSSDPPSSNLEIASLGSAGALIGGADAGDHVGASIDGLGDFNGDGAWDIVIGADEAFPSVNGVVRNYAGLVYLLFGGATLVSQDLANFVTGEAGVRIIGATAGGSLGYNVAFAGDINGDLLTDLVLGAPYVPKGSLSYVGRVYVIFGTSVPFTADLDLLNFIPGTAGYVIIGNVDNNRLGYSVSRAGDMNSDGVDDFMVGAAGTQIVYVVYGTTVVPTANLDLGAIPANTLYTITSAAGECIVGGYDVTGDGYADVLLGNYYYAGDTAVLLKGPLPRSGTRAPTHEPSFRPTAEPSSPPTSRPSQPSSVPSSQPSVQPSGAPSSRPSALPSSVPSVRPSTLPSGVPSTRPTSVPSSAPSLRPLAVPTAKPLSVPTSRPSTLAPTVVVRTSSDRTTTGHLSTGGIAGVVIGAVFLVLLLTTFALFFLAVRRGSDEQAAAPASPPAEGYEMTGV